VNYPLTYVFTSYIIRGTVWCYRAVCFFDKRIGMQNNQLSKQSLSVILSGVTDKQSSSLSYLESMATKVSSPRRNVEVRGYIDIFSFVPFYF
jgi:hypothetical protein